MEIVNIIRIAISGIGIVVIVWGVLMTVLKLLQLEYKRFRGMNICKSRELLRHHFSSYLLIGLEFMIASDIIHTVLKPTMQDLIVLGSMVAIRTVISYFLNKELRDSHDWGNA